jgi:hypothetical protein
METGTSSKLIEKRRNKAARAEFEGALSANSAFANLLARQANQKDVGELSRDKRFKLIFSGAREYTLKHAEWIHGGCKSDTYDVRDILRSQDMFLRSEVSTDEEMKVAFIDRSWVRSGKRVLTTTRADVGLWQVSNDARDWALEVENRLIEERSKLNVETLPRRSVESIYWDNREYAADDPMIIRRAVESTARLTSVEFGVIFTNDRQLVKTTANRTGMTFYRVSPSVLLSLIPPTKDVRAACMLFELASYTSSKFTFPGKNPVAISMVDTGSLDTVLMLHEDLTDKSSDLRGVNISRRTRIDFGQRFEGRFETFSYRQVERSKLLGIYDPTVRDNLGRPAYETFRPQKTVRSRVPKFEAYQDSRSNKESEQSSMTEREREQWELPALPSERY